jgi:isopentenyldiphosphate isomerase
LKHRAVHVLLFNRQGALFLQKRSQTKDSFPGTWDSSASGHLDGGEDYSDCAVREVEEELGVQLASPLEPLFKVDACPETGQEFVWVFRGQADGPFTLHPEEIDHGDWFSTDTVTRWLEQKPDDFAGGFRVIWKCYTAGAD